MITTDTITTEEQEIIAAIKRSIRYNEIVRVTDDECNHTHTVEWIASFCESVGDHLLETGERDVWGDFHGEEFRILLAQ